MFNLFLKKLFDPNFSYGATEKYLSTNDTSTINATADTVYNLVINHVNPDAIVYLQFKEFNLIWYYLFLCHHFLSARIINCIKYPTVHLYLGLIF